MGLLLFLICVMCIRRFPVFIPENFELELPQAKLGCQDKLAQKQVCLRHHQYINSIVHTLTEDVLQRPKVALQLQITRG